MKLWDKLSLAGVFPEMDARMILRVKLFNRLCWILSAYLVLRVGSLIVLGNYRALLIYATPLLFYSVIVPYLQRRRLFRLNVHISLGLGHLFVFFIGYFLFGGGFQNAVYILFLPLSFLPWIFFPTDERASRIFWNTLNLIVLGLYLFAIFEFPQPTYLLGQSADAIRVSAIVMGSLLTFLVGRFIIIAQRDYEFELRARTQEAEASRGDAERAHQEIEKLNEFSRHISSTTNLSEIVDYIFAYLAQAYGFDGCILMMPRQNETGEELFTYHHVTDAVRPKSVLDFSRSLVIPLHGSGGIVERTYRRMRPFHISDTSENLFKEPYPGIERDRDMAEKFLLKSFLLIPLIRQGKSEAIILCAASKRLNLNRAEKQAIIRFADQIAGAVLTTKLLTQVEFARQQAHDEAIRLRQELTEKEKMATLGDMAAGIVHDLRNPVAIIKGSAEMADHEDTGRDHRKQLLQIIDSEADRLLSLVQDLLDYSRGSLSINKRPTEIHDYLQRVRGTIAPLFDRKGIRLSILSTYNGNIAIDPDRFLRVIVNIAGNAADVLTTGGEFHMGVQRENGHVSFTMRDTGPGIPESIRDTIFQPFITAGKSHGTGLGMAIAKSMVEGHGGRITFKTATGQGTEFRIEVPA